MIICEVIGHVWATKKEETLNGMKLMVVRQMETGQKQPPVLWPPTWWARALGNGCWWSAAVLPAGPRQG